MIHSYHKSHSHPRQFWPRQIEHCQSSRVPTQYILNSTQHNIVIYMLTVNKWVRKTYIIFFKKNTLYLQTTSNKSTSVENLTKLTDLTGSTAYPKLHFLKNWIKSNNQRLHGKKWKPLVIFDHAYLLAASVSSHRRGCFISIGEISPIHELDNS